MKQLFSFYFLTLSLIFFNCIKARRVVITVQMDNVLSLWFADQTLTGNYWGSLFLLTADLNPGTYLLAIQGTDAGVVGGTAIGVHIDGVFAATYDTSGNWKVTGTAPAAGWNTDINYSESGWATITYFCPRNSEWPPIQLSYDGGSSQAPR